MMTARASLKCNMQNKSMLELCRFPKCRQVTFFCTQMCTKNNNGRDPRCFLPTSALISQGLKLEVFGA